MIVTSICNSLLRAIISVLISRDVKIVANIHDEWQIEACETVADHVGRLAVDSIIKAGEHFNLRCPMDGEYKVGDNWSETH